MKLPTIALFLVFTSSLLWADTFSGKVIGISDGDTITVLDTSNGEKTPTKVRLAGIDAPEKKQAFGTQAKKALSEKIFGKVVKVEYDSKDKYGRIIGNVYLGERWINKEMVEEGFAWHYIRYSNDKELAEAEKKARETNMGLWADADPIPPWSWRKEGKKTAKTNERWTR